ARLHDYEIYAFFAESVSDESLELIAVIQVLSGPDLSGHDEDYQRRHWEISIMADSELASLDNSELANFQSVGIFHDLKIEYFDRDYQGILKIPDDFDEFLQYLNDHGAAECAMLGIL
ncbi:MAG: hypothetical protein ACYCV7_11550, partial [Acidimicrobiales bacterium]